MPIDPNLCANIQQTTAAGDNNNLLVQKEREVAKTKMSATQSQGLTRNGIDGRGDGRRRIAQRHTLIQR